MTQKVPMLVCHASGIQLVPIHELSPEIFMNQFSVDRESSQLSRQDKLFCLES